MALPAALMGDDLGTECFIRDVVRVQLMTVGTLVVTFVGLRVRLVAELAIDPRRLQVVRMRGLQFHGINLVVAFNTIDVQVPDMEFVREKYVSDRRLENDFVW